MRQAYRISVLALALVIVLAVSSLGQSLGDVARAHRQQENAKSSKDKPKVITNDSLPAHPDDAAGSTPQPENSVAAPGPDSAADKQARGDQWKQAIRRQKDAIAKAQAELDKYTASIHFVEVNRYSNGVEYNQYQARKQEEAERYQKRIDEEKQKLQEMQDSARQEGFGSAVYDP